MPCPTRSACHACHECGWVRWKFGKRCSAQPREFEAGERRALVLQARLPLLLLHLLFARLVLNQTWRHRQHLSHPHSERSERLLLAADQPSEAASRMSHCVQRAALRLRHGAPRRPGPWAFPPSEAGRAAARRRRRCRPCSRPRPAPRGLRGGTGTPRPARPRVPRLTGGSAARRGHPPVAHSGSAVGAVH